MPTQFGPRRVAEVAAALDRARIAYGRISTIQDLIEHDSASLLPLATPSGTVELLAPPAIVDGARTPLRPVPALGEHDRSLRAEFAPAARRGDAA